MNCEKHISTYCSRPAGHVDVCLSASEVELTALRAKLAEAEKHHLEFIATHNFGAFETLKAKLDQAVKAKDSAVAMSEERLARAMRAEDRAAAAEHLLEEGGEEIIHGSCDYCTWETTVTTTAEQQARGAEHAKTCPWHPMRRLEKQLAGACSRAAVAEAILRATLSTAPARGRWLTEERPKVVCLCGSTRFYREFQEAYFAETMAGRIVLSVAFCIRDVSDEHGERVGITAGEKPMLDELHKRKIDLADEILVLNVGGYVGESTASEIAYAGKTGKFIRYLHPVLALLDGKDGGR